MYLERLVQHTARASDVSDFIIAYKDAFGGPPYYETYTDAYVRDEVLVPHLKDGVVIVARESGKLVGFGCALPVLGSPRDVVDHIRGLIEADAELPDDLSLSTSWYMSELGTISAYRLRGVAYQVVRSRLISISHIGGLFYFMRTARQGSNSRHLYERIGAAPIGEPQDVSGLQQTKDAHSRSLERQYMFGRVADGLQAVLARIHEGEGPTKD